MYPPENYNDTIYYPYFYMLLYAFEEDFIDFDNINATDEYYRFTVKPCFRKPYYIKIEKKNNKTYYTAKLTDGDGGYFTGTLTTSITKVFSDSLIDNVSKNLKILTFGNCLMIINAGADLMGKHGSSRQLKMGNII
jgi:hypothetical protein